MNITQYYLIMLIPNVEMQWELCTSICSKASVNLLGKVILYSGHVIFSNTSTYRTVINVIYYGTVQLQPRFLFWCYSFCSALQVVYVSLVLI